ncbi:MAG TPA: MoaD/ThiS family protein [Burkholderiaceae bacterium]|nr:MoaD/ThiS family protein [Burkholderiaceae bacterium]
MSLKGDQTDGTPVNAVAGVWIKLDGVPRVLVPGTSLAALVDQLGHAPASVGTAVNGRFVARAQRPHHVLQAGEEVLLFQPIVGG